MKTPTTKWHPFGRTEEEDLHILNKGEDTGWLDENGRPAPWPKGFLDPNAGWVTENNTQKTAKKPAVLSNVLKRQETEPQWPDS